MFESKLIKVYDLFSLKEGDRVAIENPGAYNTEAFVEEATSRSIVIGGIRYYRTTGNQWGNPDFNILKNGIYKLLKNKIVPKEKIIEMTNAEQETRYKNEIARINRQRTKLQEILDQKEKEISASFEMLQEQANYIAKLKSHVRRTEKKLYEAEKDIFTKIGESAVNAFNSVIHFVFKGA